MIKLLSFKLDRDQNRKFAIYLRIPQVLITKHYSYLDLNTRISYSNVRSIGTLFTVQLFGLGLTIGIWEDSNDID